MRQDDSKRLDAPGLRRMKRHDGRIDLYWVATKDLVKKGYKPKTVRLHHLDWNSEADRVEIAALCRRLTAEMLEWAAGGVSSKNRHGLGTIAWLCCAFETDEDSPYKTKRVSTQIFYSRYSRAIIDTVGQRHLSEVTGRDVRRWHKNWVERYGERGGYACVQTLRRVIGYGCELRDPDSLELAQVLSRTEFPTPGKRKQRPTYDQIVALVKTALTDPVGRASIALSLLLQFELGLRQKDVIGEWVRPMEGETPPVGGTLWDDPWRWQWGLMWDQIDADWILKKPTSKSNGVEIAEHDLKKHPDLLALLQSVPDGRRKGPIILDEAAGIPWRPSTFSRKFRKIATQAGWPKELWNMDSRAGAVSEAFEAGALAEDVMKAATHTQMSTTMRYNRGSLVQTGKVADLRRARRKAASETE